MRSPRSWLRYEYATGTVGRYRTPMVFLYRTSTQVSIRPLIWVDDMPSSRVVRAPPALACGAVSAADRGPHRPSSSSNTVRALTMRGPISPAQAGQANPVKGSSSSTAGLQQQVLRERSLHEAIIKPSTTAPREIIRDDSSGARQ